MLLLLIANTVYIKISATLEFNLKILMDIAVGIRRSCCDCMKYDSEFNAVCQVKMMEMR